MLIENLSGFQYGCIMSNADTNVSVHISGTQAQTFREYVQGNKTVGP